MHAGKPRLLDVTSRPLSLGYRPERWHEGTPVFINRDGVQANLYMFTNLV
jgi:hypothetical protein